jgi:hypothetical protein
MPPSRRTGQYADDRLSNGWSSTSRPGDASSRHAHPNPSRNFTDPDSRIMKAPADLSKAIMPKRPSMPAYLVIVAEG